MQWRSRQKVELVAEGPRSVIDTQSVCKGSQLAGPVRANAPQMNPRKPPESLRCRSLPGRATSGLKPRSFFGEPRLQIEPFHDTHNQLLGRGELEGFVVVLEDIVPHVVTCRALIVGVAA